MNSHPDISLPGPACWTPSPEFIRGTNLEWLRLGATTASTSTIASYAELHAWSVRNREAFWRLTIHRLGIRLRQPYTEVLDLSLGVETPRWLPDARLNIVDSCFSAAPDSPAIIYQPEDSTAGAPNSTLDPPHSNIRTVSVSELQALTNRVSNGLVRKGFRPGDALAILMPMTVEAVAIYLGIIKMGCVVVGIADSFRPKEIAARLRMAGAVGMFTQETATRGGKSFPLYADAIAADAPPIIVLPSSHNQPATTLRSRDCSWCEFLSSDTCFSAVPSAPDNPINILFSSGTTGQPKAIPWTHLTPIKCASDAHFHHNVKPGDILVWPTNIGWMMGPWLIFASLINRSAIGLYYGPPTCSQFGRFVQDSQATLLGVVPSIVKSWRATDCMKGMDWSGVSVLASTGECSCPEDMRWLMSLGRDGSTAPVIEYCGGTEIGGAYITGTVTKPCIPGTFNAPALGLDFVILNEAGQPAEMGELFVIPPSIGLSTQLLHHDHHRVYFADTPGFKGVTLRRHGDQMEHLPGDYWLGHGRNDDTMNLGGIKVSCMEIERVVQSVPHVIDVAAVAATAPEGGPSTLNIYAVCSAQQTLSISELTLQMQNALKRDLNPLFKIDRVFLLDTLPRTASNKIMRRLLRDQSCP